MSSDHQYCSTWRRVLALVHPDELSGEQRAAFEAHLPFCVACRALQAEDRELARLLRSELLPKTPLPSWKELRLRGLTSSAFLSRTPVFSGDTTRSLEHSLLRKNGVLPGRAFDIEEVHNAPLRVWVAGQDVEVIKKWQPLFPRGKHVLRNIGRNG